MLKYKGLTQEQLEDFGPEVLKLLKEHDITLEELNNASHNIGLMLSGNMEDLLEYSLDYKEDKAIVALLAMMGYSMTHFILNFRAACQDCQTEDPNGFTVH